MTRAPRTPSARLTIPSHRSLALAAILACCAALAAPAAALANVSHERTTTPDAAARSRRAQTAATSTHPFDPLRKLREKREAEQRASQIEARRESTKRATTPTYAPATTTPPPTATTSPGAATTPGAVTVPGATTSGTTPAPGAGNSSSTPAPTATNGVRASKRDRPLSTGAIAIAAVAALLVLACIAWALARNLAYEPRWLVTLRHATAEAGFRASATWSEFVDWARLGR